MVIAVYLGSFPSPSTSHLLEYALRSPTAAPLACGRLGGVSPKVGGSLTMATGG